MQRQSDDRSSSRTTVRLLESLVRLACAHAKLMFRNTVIIQDAVTAIACVASSQIQLHGYGSLSSTSSNTWGSISLGASKPSGGTSSFLHYDFPSSPDEEYIILESQIFSALHCTKETIIDRDRHSSNLEMKENINISRFQYLEDNHHSKSNNIIKNSDFKGLISQDQYSPENKNFNETFKNNASQFSEIDLDGYSNVEFLPFKKSKPDPIPVSTYESTYLNSLAAYSADSSTEGRPRIDLHEDNHPIPSTNEILLPDFSKEVVKSENFTLKFEDDW
jgi:hypothetical protein